MIKIVYKEDLKLLKDTIVGEYIKEYFDTLVNTYNVKELSTFGAIYLLEDKEDEKNYIELGLVKPINKTFGEFTDLLIIKGNREVEKVLHSCFVVSDSYAISVFVELGVLSQETEEHLLSESNIVEICIERVK